MTMLPTTTPLSLKALAALKLQDLPREVQDEYSLLGTNGVCRIAAFNDALLDWVDIRMMQKGDRYNPEVADYQYALRVYRALNNGLWAPMWTLAEEIVDSLDACGISLAELADHLSERRRSSMTIRERDVEYWTFYLKRSVEWRNQLLRMQEKWERYGGVMSPWSLK